jgi:hypothetical protein
MHVDPRRRTVQLRKRPADGPGKFQAGVYDVDCRVPGSGGLVPLGVVSRTDNAKGVTICWQWAVTDPEGVIPDALGDLRVAGGAVPTKRDAVAQLAEAARTLTEHLSPPEDHGSWELDAWVPAGQPVTAEVVAEALDALGELLDLFLLDGTPGTLEEKVRLYAKVRDLHKREGRLDALTHDLKVDLREGLTVAEVDGRIWKAKRVNKRTGYDKDALRDAINRAALRAVPDFDEATGEVLGTHEPTPAEAVGTVWKAADVAVGRTKVLREQFGVDLDEYAQSNWSTDIVEVAERDLPPEELAVLRGEGVDS